MANTGTSNVAAGDHTECPTTDLSHSAMGRVEVCQCGLVTLHIGAVALRFTASALEEVSELLTGAIVNGRVNEARATQLQRLS